MTTHDIRDMLVARKAKLEREIDHLKEMNEPATKRLAIEVNNPYADGVISAYRKEIEFITLVLYKSLTA